METSIDVFGISDIGKKRQTNEDQFLIADLRKALLIEQTSLQVDDNSWLFGDKERKLLVVADGMGGHADGKLASKIAVKTITRYMTNTMPWFYKLKGDEDLEDELRGAIEKCDERIDDATADKTSQRKMGTTITMAYILWPTTYVVHAGDSRCYLYRSSVLTQVTTDHTLAQKLVQEGTLELRDAEKSRFSNVLVNVLGGDSKGVKTEVNKLELQQGDTLLLCSDGLMKHVDDSQIASVLGRNQNAEEMCRELVARANKDGGSDNVTVIVARVV